MYPASNASRQRPNYYGRDDQYSIGESVRSHQRPYQQTPYYPPANFSEYSRAPESSGYYESREFRPNPPPSRQSERTYYPPERTQTERYPPPPTHYIANDQNMYDSRRNTNRNENTYTSSSNFPMARASSRNTHRADYNPPHRTVLSPQQYIPNKAYGSEYSESSRLEPPHYERNYFNKDMGERRFESRREYPDESNKASQFGTIRKSEDFHRMYGNTNAPRSYLMKPNTIPEESREVNLETKQLPGSFRHHSKQMESILRSTSQMSISEMDQKRDILKKPSTQEYNEDREIPLKPKKTDKLTALRELQSITLEIASMTLDRPAPIQTSEWKILLSKIEAQVNCLETIIGDKRK